MSATLLGTNGVITMAVRKVLPIYVIFALTACANNDAERLRKERHEQNLMEATARNDLEKFTKDPLAIQIRNLRKIPQGICGEANLKDETGVYQGFLAFLDRSNFRGDESFNPTIADPDSVFSIRGTERRSKIFVFLLANEQNLIGSMD